METNEAMGVGEDWSVICGLMPEGWKEKAKELGALTRYRKFKDGETLLRTLLIHLSEGCSLRETAIRARESGLTSLSDVALLKRLRSSGEWFRWIAQGIMQQWIMCEGDYSIGSINRIRAIDGSIISEPGRTGSNWRIHYSIELPTLSCTEIHVTKTDIGESFCNFMVEPGDLFIGDRGYATRRGIYHVVQGEGAVLVRINLNLPLLDLQGNKINLLDKLRSLTGKGVGDWDVLLNCDDGIVRGRVCAIKKSNHAAEKSIEKTLKENQRKGKKAKPKTLESAKYTFIFTTLGREYSPTSVLEMYRGRWQIELVFKRLKSIIGLGHLRKYDEVGAKAWIHGKLLVAFLVEALIIAGSRFSPWGYRLPED